jgi:hypothetical protein
MSIEYEIDHAKRLVVVVCHGEVGRLDIEEYLDKVVVADALPYAKIFDTTNATAALDDADMMALGARIRAYDGISEMGPLAIVAAAVEAENRARQFAALAGANRPVEIFRTVAAAERWLEAQTMAGQTPRPTRPSPKLRSLLAF